MLSGGNCGGDMCVCIYDPCIVRGFHLLPPTKQPDHFIEDNFERQSKFSQIATIFADISSMPRELDQRQNKLRKLLASNIYLPPVDLYNALHDNAVYVDSFGYDAPATIRNAFMLRTLYDSRWSCLWVKERVYRRDKKLGGEALRCLTHEDSNLPSNPINRPEGPPLGHFVLDDLMGAGSKMHSTYAAFYEGLQPVDIHDEDPPQPHKKAVSHAVHPSLREDLAKVQRHVEKHVEMWRTLTRSHETVLHSPPQSSAGLRRSSTLVKKQDEWGDLMRSFANGPAFAVGSPMQLLDVEAIKAAWAYHEEPAFAWKVAFQTLCRIKATSTGFLRITSLFADMVV
ncbi:hypothetical protein C8Q78DRAFT_1084063 [Trametes maxima]|nr:hypothetical protein C8Q78DRAFT_1084063 [Trametes maxima]